MWNSFTNQASNEIWFAMTVVMKILSFNIYKAMKQKPFARSNRNVQIDQNSNLTILIRNFGRVSVDYEKDF